MRDVIKTPQEQHSVYILRSELRPSREAVEESTIISIAIDAKRVIAIFLFAVLTSALVSGDL